ncbi:methylated-DNA--[protein]-cysteine S-methyltransferase [Oceanihabitans sediminis]|uniref:Methylated-DNA--protein-cysteine methyltransferase n=1 Tax=Oceanihabitans sediminis TaxID=1812012 RepID=A0A368P8M5_9FLAO|nr:methylated-DNA--[protein]-cysteine S-methyltransferase [Oceanihabitans sediminis]MDX1278091.1 methylated-DNA--[protein]-cysteine S-methyltransferase [Oceanihabitans sediminis]MDX1772920.1 methylated-DNA--[protein]-cysteine S-methyltransferase [Oceanihabitans sediminis]RBP34605.1 methylated-DNA-[protein]-cysteine S-methyltransferase [Oceanihabitans sediminis]RCU58265.1 methylated-DNA--[protein]-cysteine S-methyltransferase [Oceanihabitans sediminis]
MVECIINTPLGYTKILGDSDGIASITVLNQIEHFEEETNKKEFLKNQESTIKTTDIIPLELEDCVLQLQEYFKGSRKTFRFKTNAQGTDFQKRVWKALENIPFGKTTTYLKLAKKLGDVKAIRAVANANGKNPLWIVVPCHRVIGSDDSLTGYAGGLQRKQWLLEHESPYKQQSLF